MMNYFFYKDYMFNKKIKHSNPLWISVIMVSIMELFNGLAILLIINKLFFEIKVNTVPIELILIGIGLILFVINAKYFNANKKRICDRYLEENLTLNIVGYVCYILYFIGSIVLLILLK